MEAPGGNFISGLTWEQSKGCPLFLLVSLFSPAGGGGGGEVLRKIN